MRAETVRIAMFGHKRIPSREGGVEIVVEELSTRMARLGHQVTCYNRSGHPVGGTGLEQPRKNYQGVSIRPVWTLQRKGLAAVTSSFCAAWCSGFSKADVVHIHAEGPAFMCWLPKMLGKRVVVTVHGLDWQREKWKGGLGAAFIRAGEKMTVRFADEIIVLSENMGDYFKNTYGKATVRIPNGANRPAIAAAEQITQQFALRKDGYILFLGRLVPEKGIHYLIEAFRQLKTDKKLVIAGGASDTEAYVKKLKAMAAGDERIVFTGFVQGQLLEELYSNAYLYVLPSDVEGMPLSLLEAMSYGNCCVVSDIPECAEVTGDKAVLFPRGNATELRACLQGLCEDPERVEQYRAASREYICGKYRWNDVVEKTLALYRAPVKEPNLRFARIAFPGVPLRKPSKKSF